MYSWFLPNAIRELWHSRLSLRESRVSFAERKTTVVLIVVKLFGTSSHVDSCYEIGVSVFGVAVYA